MLKPVVLTMTLSHGQAELERGFNNSSLVLKDHLKIDSIVATTSTVAWFKKSFNLVKCH